MAAILGGIIALGMIVLRGHLRNNLQNTSRDPRRPGSASASVSEVADKAARRKPRMHLLPYGIPLCLGFIGYLIYLHGF